MDARTDLFALGVTFYRIFSGRLPFTGDTATALLRSHGKETPPPAHELPRALQRILGKLLDIPSE